MHTQKNIFVVGGTGFVGEAVVRQLIHAGMKPFLLVRKESEKKIPSDILASVTIIQSSIENFQEIEFQLREKKIDAIIYLLGLIRENPKQKIFFQDYHLVYMQNMITIANHLGIKRFIYMSANGTKSHGTSYQTTKYAAEEFLRRTSLAWTIIKPSIIIGKDSKLNFLQLIDSLISSKVVPIFGDGLYKIAPVGREDVASIFITSLLNDRTINKSYIVCGLNEITYNDFVKLCLKTAKKKAFLLHISLSIAKYVGKLGLYFASFPFTSDQVKMITEGNTSSDDTVWKENNIVPKKLTDLLNEYYK